VAQNPLQDSILDSKACCEQILMALDRLGDAAYLPTNAAEISALTRAAQAVHLVLSGADAVVQQELVRWGL
jgi:alpha-D-ribose 1-methylphosphonate 5-triphosphate synthase subunit PhnH